MGVGASNAVAVDIVVYGGFVLMRHANHVRSTTGGQEMHADKTSPSPNPYAARQPQATQELCLVMPLYGCPQGLMCLY